RPGQWWRRAAPEPLPGRVEARVRRGRQRVEGGDARGHRRRVRVERPAMADARRALARVVGAHDVGPATEGADGQAAADDLAERREVGPDAEPLLRPAPRNPERDDLVEDQNDPVALRE